MGYYEKRIKMPKVAVTNDNVNGTVLRPVVFDLVRQIQAWTGCAPTKIIFPGDAEVMFQPGSTVDNENGFNRTNAMPIWQVAVKEEYIHDELLTTAVFQSEHSCYFEDNDIGVRLRPIYSTSKLTLSFEMRTTDVNEARRWRDEYRTNFSNGRDVRSSIVNYSYFIPKEIFPLLEHMHHLRESQGGYGQTYEEYLKQYMAPSITQVSTFAGTEQRYAVKEQAGRLTGLFDFDSIPDEPTKQGENAAYKQVFSFTVHFASPIATAVDYPVLVHNQVIDSKYILHQPKDDRDIFQSRSPRSVQALSAFEIGNGLSQTIKSGLRLPDFSEFYPKTAPAATLQVLSALVGVTEGSSELMSFYEIDERWEFRKEFLDYLKSDHKFLHKYGESIVNVTVYDGDMPLHHTLFHVDENLNVVINGIPDIRKTYYVRLSLLTRMALLSRAAKDRVRQEANALRMLAATIAPSLVKAGKLPQPLPGTNYIGRAPADKLFNDIDQLTDGYRGGLLMDHAIVQFNTVMILYIDTHLKKE